MDEIQHPISSRFWYRTKKLIVSSTRLKLVIRRQSLKQYVFQYRFFGNEEHLQKENDLVIGVVRLNKVKINAADAKVEGS